MNGAACASEPAKMSQVQDQIVTLENAISRTEDLAGVVRQKLSSVLTEPMDREKDSGADIDPPVVPLASQLREYTIRTHAIADILADVIERMEL